MKPLTRDERLYLARRADFWRRYLPRAKYSLANNVSITARDNELHKILYDIVYYEASH